MPKDRVIIPSALPQTYEQRLRWHSCENTTSEEIPPFACMQLKKPIDLNTTWLIDAEEDDWFCQDVDNGELIWFVSKCDKEGEARQNPSQFVFNGPTPIPPRRGGDRKRARGRCHQDYPAQVLHNGDLDSLPNWRKCGPARNTWQVWSGGSAFLNICHDVTVPIGTGHMHTVWVTRGGIRAGGHASVRLSTNQYTAGSWLATSGSGQNVDSENIESQRIVVRRSGMWKFGFQAKVTAGNTVPRGAELLLRLYKEGVPASDGQIGALSSTIWEGAREQDIEEDQYGGQIFYSAENVAFSGIENLLSGEALRIRNDSSHPLTISRGSFWLSHDAAFHETGSSQGGLHFP
jgi:hypothetical protein